MSIGLFFLYFPEIQTTCYKIGWTADVSKILEVQFRYLDFLEEWYTHFVKLVRLYCHFTFKFGGFWCSNPGCRVSVVTSSVEWRLVCMGPQFWNVVHSNHFAPTILRWFLDFWNICVPLVSVRGRCWNTVHILTHFGHGICHHLPVEKVEQNASDCCIHFSNKVVWL